MTKTKKLRSSLLSGAMPISPSVLFASLAISVAPGAALAQDDSSGDAAEQSSDQIVVTGRRREEVLQDVPESMRVFNDVEIERSGIDRLNDFAALTPNLHFFDDQEVGVGTISIRGVTQNRGTGEAPLAFVIDGVPIANSFLTTQDLFDIQQIEVLRGPQGALYGRNSIGGAINITTQAPSNDPEYRLRVTGKEGNDYAARASVSGPLIPNQLFYRASVSWGDREGQLRNAISNEFVDFNESISTRLRLLFDNDSPFTADFRGQYAKQEGGSGYFIPVSVAGDDPFELPLFNTVGTIQSNILGVSSVEFHEFTGKFDYEFSPGTLTSITSYNKTMADNNQDLDQTALPVINVIADDESEMISQEIRFVSNSDQPFRYLFGGYLQSEKRDRVISTSANAPCLFTATTCDPAFAFFVDVPPSVSNTESLLLAAFAQFNYDITPDLELTFALRYDSDERKNTAIGAQETFTDIQPKASLAYNVTDNSLLYVTYSEGFRSGGFNNIDPMTSPFAPGFEAEKLKNYEAGFKTSWWDNVLTLNGAFYLIDYKNQQFFLFNANGEQALVNAPSTEIYGGEVEFVFRPTNELLFQGGFGFTESEIESFNQVPGLLVPAANVIGQQVPNAPINSLNVISQYTKDISNSLTFVGRVEFERRGTTYYTIDNGNPQDSYNLTNLRLTLEHENWALTVFGENLFDTDYQEWFFASRFVGLPTDLSWPNRPRQFGAELSLRF